MTLISRVGSLLDRAGILDEARSRESISLAWPRVLTGFARMSQATIDFVIVGLALGPPALAGMGFALAYYGIVNQISLGLGGGTISLVSQAMGKEDHERASTIMTISVLLAVLTVLPVIVILVQYASELIGVLTADSTTVEYGEQYLRVIAVGLVFATTNSVATRSFAAVEDTFTPMIIRVVAAIINVVLTIVLVLVLELGVVGAAVGTVVATGSVTVTLLWGLAGGSYPTREALPIRLRFDGLTESIDELRRICSVSFPLVLMNLAGNVYIFPLLAVVSTYGATVVAAFEISRRVRDVINCPSWGLSVAASTLVGREIGEKNPTAAREYGRDIVRLTLLVYIGIVAIVVGLATPIARLFVASPDAVRETARFLRLGAVGAVGLGLSGAFVGVLRGAGDTRWPFYATLVGLYAFTLPLAYLGTWTSLGIVTLYVAVVTEPIVPAWINFSRFRSEDWLDTAV